MNDADLIKQALAYHESPTPGKIAITITKPTETQHDLSLAYTPGVGVPVKAIASDPANAYKYTNKANLVAVITNGTAVLGFGNLGALASKPVMEGKAVLFKHLAGIDVFDIEIDCDDPVAFVDTVARIAPTFGGINLEDIKAPECFFIEQELIKRLNIPVMHDDQHGTAIVVAAGILNALAIQNKDLHNIKVVCLGAGAAGIAVSELLLHLGLQREQLIMLDSKGVITTARHDLNEYKRKFALNLSISTLQEAMQDADVFIGVSGPNIVTAEHLKSMKANPVIFALSNPVPEIAPELVMQVRQDAIMATGRSDYDNQVNNALVFPYIFKAALTAKTSTISTAMKVAAVHALKDLARLPVPDEVLQLYPHIGEISFGKSYILPKLLDPRLGQILPGAIMKMA